MNTVFISSDACDADFFKHEVEKSAPAIHVDLSPSVMDAMVRFASGEACDAVILDTSITTADAISLVTFVRKEKKSPAVLALRVSEDMEQPAELLNAGVDQVVAKRPGYPSSLLAIIQKLQARQRVGAAPPRKQVRLLYAGNIEAARRHLSGVSQLKLEPAPISEDGTWNIPGTGVPPADALILDLPATGAQLPHVIKEAAKHFHDTPIIPLTDPGDDATVIHALRAGAADCVVKTGNYFHRLLLVLQREIGRREILRERTSLRSRAERFRYIVENQPTGVTVIAPNGTFLSVNDQALKLLGAERLDQVIGKSISDLLSTTEQPTVLELLAEVCEGNTKSIQLALQGLDGTRRNIELRAAPLKREENGSTAALAVLNDNGENQEITAEEKARLKATAAKYASKLEELEEQLIQQKSAGDSEKRYERNRFSL
jgi:PAS domain S-box-containing protein